MLAESVSFILDVLNNWKRQKWVIILQLIQIFLLK